MSHDPIGEAARAALEGRLIVFPTDTVYGIGSRPDDPDATERIFAAKRRERDLALPVLATSAEMARGFAEFDGRADALADAFWPGALTLVLPRSATSRSWDLGGDQDTIGVRVPGHLLAGAVLTATGPLAVTSANRSGEDPGTTCEELHRSFGDLVEVYLCEEHAVVGASSTVLDLAHGPPRVLRAGDVGPDAIGRFLPAGEALIDSRPSS